MANIKNKFSQPLSTEFSPKDLVVDIKNGHLYYKSNLGVHKLIGDNLNTDTKDERGYFTAGIEVVGNITASGNVSASETIFTDTISSPSNNLAVSSSTVTITTSGSDANLILQADTGNNDEANNPYMTIEQDGGGMRSIIGLTGADSEWPDGGPLLNGKNNYLTIGTSGSAGSARGIQLVTLNTASLTVSSSGNVGIGINDPLSKLHVVGNPLSGGTNASASLYVVGDNVGSKGYVARFENINSSAPTSADGIVIQLPQEEPGATNKFIEFRNNADNSVGAVKGDAGGGVSFDEGSDIRLKKEISPTKYGIEDLMGIEIVEYKYKNSNNFRTGIIAQQAIDYYPPAVKDYEEYNIEQELTPEDKEYEYMTVAYQKYIPLLMKSLQDSYTQITELEKRIKKLENG